MSMDFYCYDETGNFTVKNNELYEYTENDEFNLNYRPDLNLNMCNSNAALVAGELGIAKNLKSCAALDMHIDKFITVASEYLNKHPSLTNSYVREKVTEMLYIANICKVRGAFTVALV